MRLSRAAFTTKRAYTSLAMLALLAAGCSKDSGKGAGAGNETPRIAGKGNPKGKGSAGTAIGKLGEKNSEVRQQIVENDRALKAKRDEDAKRLAELEAQLAALKDELGNKADSSRVTDLEDRIAALKQKNALDIAALQTQIKGLREFANGLESKILQKVRQGSLGEANARLIAQTFEGHTPTYKLAGGYHTLVIPVEFTAEADVGQGGFNGSLANRAAFLDGTMQKEIFGEGAGSLSSYYRHASGGMLSVTGDVVNPVRVEKPLSYYGKAVQGSNDEHARELVVDALKQVMASKGASKDFWHQFDKWDLNDLDADGNFYEPDGFIDAVILVYAGKSQASCQRTFDPEAKRPGTDDVDKDDPRRAAKVDCFNRIWPHRWSVFLEKESPDAPKSGPKREGNEGPAVGFRINDELHAFDYNMQSEYSDLSTFVHEFGHSLTLPDTYAYSGENNVGEWDLMARNSSNAAQEISGYNKLTLGWLAPKIVEAGKPTSLYLGRVNYVPEVQRDFLSAFTGPLKFMQWIDGQTHAYDVTSTVPSTGEAVFRSAMLRTKPTTEVTKVVDVPSSTGERTAYSGRYDNATRSVKLRMDVPESGDATLSFDTIYHVETETNFASKEPEIKVVTDYDIGFVKIDGETKEELRTVSGDENSDSLAEKNPDCKVDVVLALRRKGLEGELTAEEKTAFAEGVALCQKPVWVTKSYDLSALRGRSVNIEVGLSTDSGYTEFGVFVDNVTLGGMKIDFEDGSEPAGGFVVSKNGSTELKTNQFYLFEYRDPAARFTEGSYNKDRNISRGGMAMFLPEEKELSPTDRFRIVATDYQPGVLTWYYNSRFDSRSNNPQTQNGQGYVLTVGSEVRELVLPGPYGDASLRDEQGFYQTTSEAFKEFETTQINEFKCFGYTAFATYLDAKAPDCGSYPQVDALEGLTLEGKKLMFSRKSFNDFLPSEQRRHLQVSNPLNALRLLPSYRTALNTFRAPEAKDFRPFKVYKVGAANELVLDEELTEASAKYSPMSSFDDAKFGLDAAHLKDPRLSATVAIVQPKGVMFRVEKPASDVLSQYGSKDRAPKAKLYIDWNPQTAAAADSAVRTAPMVRSGGLASGHVHDGSCAHLHD